MSAPADGVPSVYLSFDFELGWGVVESGAWRARERASVYERLIEVFPRLLDTLESREVPVDWATVGALLVSPERVPTDHLPRAYGDKVRAFVAQAAAGTVDGRRLVDRLVATRHQRLVSHGMTHVVLDRPDVTHECVRAEIGHARRVLAPVTDADDVLVLPENRRCADELLRDAGVRVIRTGARYSAGRAASAFQKLLSPPEAVVSGERLRELSGSLLFQPRGRRRRDRAVLRVRRAAVLGAVKRGRSVCLWLHPFNFGIYPHLLDDLTGLLDALDSERRAGRARFASMADVR